MSCPLTREFISNIAARRICLERQEMRLIECGDQNTNVYVTKGVSVKLKSIPRNESGKWMALRQSTYRDF